MISKGQALINARKIIYLFCFFLFSVAHGTEKAPTPVILYSKTSSYGLIEVVRIHNTLCVCENRNYALVHSIIDQEDTTYLGAEYEPLATASFCFSKNIKKALLLGLGGGGFLSYFLNYFSQAHVDAIDINPVMIDIVKNFRKVDTKNRVTFHCTDAFIHIAKTQKSYDLIYCDIYFFKPSMIVDYKKFFKKVREHLNEGGVFIWNACIPLIPRVVVEDMFANFDNIVAAVTQCRTNVIFLCYQGPAKTKENLEEIAKELQVRYNFRYSLPDIFQEFQPIPSQEYEAWAARFPILS